MRKLLQILDLVEFEPLKEVFSSVIAAEMMEMYKFDTLTEMVKLAYQM